MRKSTRPQAEDAPTVYRVPDSGGRATTSTTAFAVRRREPGRERAARGTGLSFFIRAAARNRLDHEPTRRGARGPD